MLTILLKGKTTIGCDFSPFFKVLSVKLEGKIG